VGQQKSPFRPVIGWQIRFPPQSLSFEQEPPSFWSPTLEAQPAIAIATSTIAPITRPNDMTLLL
jgi:hypothetical protein